MTKQILFILVVVAMFGSQAFAQSTTVNEPSYKQMRDCWIKLSGYDPKAVNMDVVFNIDKNWYESDSLVMRPRDFAVLTDDGFIGVDLVNDLLVSNHKPIKDKKRIARFKDTSMHIIRNGLKLDGFVSESFYKEFKNRQLSVETVEKLKDAYCLCEETAGFKESIELGRAKLLQELKIEVKDENGSLRLLRKQEISCSQPSV